MARNYGSCEGINGNRRIPQEINEHDCIWCGEKYGFNVYTIQTGDVIYTHTANPEQVKDRKNYIRGQTIITNMKGSKYLFYGFPKTDSKGNPAGDPFGSKNLNADFTAPCSSNSSVIIGNIDYSAYSEYDKSNYAQFDFNQNYTTTEKQKRFDFLFEGATVQIDSKFHAFLNGVECRQHESDGANCSSNLKALTESITVPQCGEIRVHKKLSGIFKQILNIIAYQTTFKIYTCTTNWEYRDFTSDPHLSHHAFGSAIDINSNDNPWYSWSCNQYPAESGVVCYDTRNPKAVPEEIGNIFRKFGFKWHNWLETYNGKQIPRDPMHFSWTFN